MAEELKACPFCGGRSHHILGARQIRMLDVVKCLDCFAEIQGTYEPESALNKWNTRAQVSQGGEAVEVFNFDHVLYGQISNGWPEDAIELIDTIPAEPLMTVAQHQRILAASVGSGEPTEYQQLSRYGNWDRIDKAVFELGMLGNCPEKFRALYTHPADQVADDLTMVKVPRELLERVVKADASKGANALQLVDGWSAMQEIRALLAKSEGVKK